MTVTIPAPSLRRYSPQHAKTGHTAALATTGLAAVLLPLVLSTGAASADTGTPAPAVSSSFAGALTPSALQPPAATDAAQTPPTIKATAAPAPAPSVIRAVAERAAPRTQVADLREATELKISGPLTQTAGYDTIAAGQLWAGTPVEGETLALQVDRGNGAWATIKTATTDQHGVARMNYQLPATSRVRVYFPGDGGHKPTASPTADITVQVPAPTLGQRAVIEAAKHYGARYRYGSTGPSTFDCSGLTGYVYRQLGVNLPRTSGQQERAVRQVPVSAMQTGDLVFTWTGGRVSHVGIYDAGNGMMWAATHSGDIVRPQAIYSRNITVGRVG